MVAGRRQLKNYKAKKGGYEMLNDVNSYIAYVLNNDNSNAKYILNKYRNNDTFKSTVLYNLHSYSEQQKNKVKSHLIDNIGSLGEKFTNFIGDRNRDINKGFNDFVGMFNKKKVDHSYIPKTFNNSPQSVHRYNPEAIPQGFAQPSDMTRNNGYNIETFDNNSYPHIPEGVTLGNVEVGNKHHYDSDPVSYPGDIKRSDKIYRKNLFNRLFGNLENFEDDVRRMGVKDGKPLFFSTEDPKHAAMFSRNAPVRIH